MDVGNWVVCCIVPYDVRSVTCSVNGVVSLESQFVYEGGELREPWKDFGSKEAICSITKKAPAPALTNVGECSCTVGLPNMTRLGECRWPKSACALAYTESA